MNGRFPHRDAAAVFWSVFVLQWLFASLNNEELLEKTMQKLIKNNWSRTPGEQFAKIGILNHAVHPEGLDIDRLRFYEPGRLEPKRDVGHIISVLKGGGSILVDGEGKSPFRLTEGVHLYIPPAKRVS